MVPRDPYLPGDLELEVGEPPREVAGVKRREDALPGEDEEKTAGDGAKQRGAMTTGRTEEQPEEEGASEAVGEREPLQGEPPQTLETDETNMSLQTSP